MTSSGSEHGRVLAGRPRLVRRRLPHPDAGPARRLAGDRERQPHPRRGAHRVRQDARRVPLGPGPARSDAAARRQDQALPGPLRLPDEGARRRHRAQPSGAAGRAAPDRGPARAARPPTSRSASAPATPLPTSGAGWSLGHRDVLITTPESLFLMLTSQARESLRGVDTVIIDEVHAVAGTKRGAHLAVSLERLDELLERPAQRIGLSATVRPVDEVARFLGGARPVAVVAPAVPQAMAARGRRARRGHERPRGQLGSATRPIAGADLDELVPLRRAGPRRRADRFAGARAVVDLAARRGADRHPGRAAPVHDRVRELAAARGAADGAAQRDRGRATRRGACRAEPAGAADGAERRGQGTARAAGPGAPRLREQGAARDHRGRR